LVVNDGVIQQIQPGQTLDEESLNPDHQDLRAQFRQLLDYLITIQGFDDMPDELLDEADQVEIPLT